MARLARLALAGQAHHVVQRGHNRQPVFLDDADRRAYLDALHEAAATLGVAVFGYVLMPDHVHLLLQPREGPALSGLMQALGRRYGAGFNRRHGRAGTLWDGRFRAAPLEGGDTLLTVLRCIEQNPVRAGLVMRADQWAWSSAAHHLGQRRDAVLTTPDAYWQLGNTPFDRQAAWLRLLEELLPPAVVAAVVDSAIKGWPLGSGAFLANLAAQVGRPVAPRARGRPKGAASAA